ncbi:CocE/NonD family hydrolase [bacterium]|nr:CocE/NonD family hydrolase [bacterium]
MEHKPQVTLSILISIFIFSCLVNAYTVQTEMVAMRDSVRLATDIYQPVTSKPPWPVILMRTPYKRSSAVDPTLALIVCNFMHYTLVVQNTRGRFQSEGTDSLYFSDGWGDIQDGYDTVGWIESQSWCNGKIGSFGASALGMTQYFMAGAAPPALDCCLVIVAASNIYEDALFYGGVYRESLVDGWLGGNRAEHLIDFFSEHPLYSPMYDRLNFLTRLDSVRVPILHVGGWHDIFIQGQINAFDGLQREGGSGAQGRQKLIIGPWVHDIASKWTGELRFPESDAMNWIGVMIDWFDYYLKDQKEESVIHMPAVQYYLMGDPDLSEGPGNRWIFSEHWPPDYQEIPFYLRSGGLLSLDPPEDNELPEEFAFDPDDPVPTAGGRNLNIPAGSMDQRELESRNDVLVYTTPFLDDSVIVTGPVSVTIYASSDAVDTDFSARLCDVYPDGRSMLVADGIVRARHRRSIREEEFLVPGEVAEFDIDLWSTAIAFAPGHAIRVDVSSSNYPRFSVNPNTGEPFRQASAQIVAHQKIYHTSELPSFLNLPVVSGIDTDIRDKISAMPVTDRLDQNFPNPFNAHTVIPVLLPSGTKFCSLKITDVLGRTVRQWKLDGMSGRLRIVWNGEDHQGHRAPTGVYMIQLAGDKFQQIRKTVLLK